MKTIADDCTTLIALNIIDDYMTKNMDECGEGWWKHKDGDEFVISMSDYNDVMRDLEEFLKRRIEKAVTGK